MMETGTTIHYFSTGNTARGYFNINEGNWEQLTKLFVIQGQAFNGKSDLLRNIANHFIANDIKIELIHCALDAEAITGVILSTLQIGIVAEELLEGHDADNAFLEIEIVDLDGIYNLEKLTSRQQNLIEFISKKNEACKNAYDTYAEALAIHDEWEAIYIGNTDFEKLNTLTDKLTEIIFEDIDFPKNSMQQHRFLGAATAKGAVDFVPNLTATIQKRYLLKGRPGSGKSTLLKKLAQFAKQRGIDVEIYHCGFDPHSLDMLIFRELSIAIFDSTAPHEYFPTHGSDEIIDLYKIAILPRTDEIFAEQLNFIASRYKQKMIEGTEYLTLAKGWQDQIDLHFINALDSMKMRELEHQIEQQIHPLVN